MPFLQGILDKAVSLPSRKGGKGSESEQMDLSMQRLSSPTRKVVIVIGSLTMPLSLNGCRRYKLGMPLAGSCCVVSLAWRRTEIRHCTLTGLKAAAPTECRSYAGLCRASAVANEQRG